MGEKAPDPGWTTRGIISRVIDGDTVEVEITRKRVVRLRDCWAPEKRLDPSLPEIDRNAAKLRGVASAVHLKQLAEGQPCTVSIPTHAGDDGVTQDIADSLTMGRVVGDVWIDGGLNLAAIQVQRGYATRTKGGGK